MTLDLKESKELCDWLMSKGLGLGESAEVLFNIGCDDTLAVALVKVFQNRKEKMGKLNEKCFDWTYSSPGQRV